MEYSETVRLSYIKVAEGLDVESIYQDLLKSDAWDKYPQRRTFPNSPHAEMVDIWARFGKPEDMGGPHESEWYEAATESIKDICFKIMYLVRGETLGGVLITKLQPGGHIAPHVDSGWHAGYYEKFYLSIRSPKNSVFGFECGNIESKPGDLYWFRNDVPHWVTNDTDEERISMIICIKTDEF